MKAPCSCLPQNAGLSDIEAMRREAANALLFGAGSMLVGHLSAVHWLAKDLVWVLPDMGCSQGHQGGAAGLREWVKQYQLPKEVSL